VIVLLTPGPANAAYFEHALLARLMGVELVEGGDLTCSGNRVFVHTTQGLRPVDVIYRRLDDDFLDPLQFRPDSVIGCPGIVNAARAGNVTIANAVGNGVADDKLLYTWVPDLIRYYLREEPLLPNVQSYRLDDPEVLHWVLGHLDQLVLKPVDGAGGAGIVIGPRAGQAALAALRARVAAQPRGWIAQQPVALSTSPVLIGEQLAPRHIDLRPFAVNDGTDVWLLPGGLTRVALPEGELVVNSSRGRGPAGHRADPVPAGLRPGQPECDRGRRAGRAARGQERPRGHLQRDVAVPQRGQSRPGRPPEVGRAARAARVPGVHPGAGRAVLRPDRVHHEPRRRVVVPDSRPQPGAGGHDRPAAAGPDAAGPSAVGWPMLLRSCGAYESFIRTRTWSGEAQPVIEFLLADRLFPRSVVHALGTAEQALAALDPAGGGALRDPARRSLGELRTRLEYADPVRLPGLLPDLLPTLQRSCVQASEAISARYFSYEHAVTWAQEC
jgi:Circularly permuted ATP-grasp type 2/A predicted alpha-helical domain with a conserved ER motif.